MASKLGAKLKVIKGERYLKGTVRCERCGSKFKLFWREDFIVSRYFHCADCDEYLKGCIEQAKQEAAENPDDPWPFSMIFFDV